MNKIIKTMFGAFALGAVMCMAVSAVHAAPAAPKKEALKEGEAGIVHVEGDVKVTAPSGIRISAEEGKLLPDGARIQTGATGRLQIGMSPDLGKTVLVEEKTVVTVTPKDDTKIDLERGSVFAALDTVKPGTKFQFETPRGIAGVRGTILRIISLLSSDKDAVMVADGEVAAFSPDYKELGGIRGGNKGYIGQNQPLFTEPLSPADVKQMQGLRNFTEMNKRDFNALVGGFAARPADVHAPKKTGPAGGKSSKKPGYDPETGPTGPGGGFIQTDSREFMDNQFRGHGDNQRQPLEQRPQEPPRREESHP